MECLIIKGEVWMGIIITVYQLLWFADFVTEKKYNM